MVSAGNSLPRYLDVELGARRVQHGLMIYDVYAPPLPRWPLIAETAGEDEGFCRKHLLHWLVKPEASFLEDTSRTVLLCLFFFFLSRQQRRVITSQSSTSTGLPIHVFNGAFKQEILRATLFGPRAQEGHGLRPEDRDLLDVKAP